jgi:hypothetical protein
MKIEIEYEVDLSPANTDDEIIRKGINDFNNKLHNDPVSHHSIFANYENRIIGGALIYQHSDAIQQSKCPSSKRIGL